MNSAFLVGSKKFTAMPIWSEPAVLEPEEVLTVEGGQDKAVDSRAEDRHHIQCYA